MPDKEAVFRLGKYWLDREDGRPNWYRYWYDAGTRKTRRATTDTADFEEATIILAAVVLEEGGEVDDPEQGAEPKLVRLVTALNHYWKHYSDKRPNKGAARYAGETVLKYMDQAMGGESKVGDLSKARVKAFMVYSRDTLNHSVSTISRNLSIVNAALNFGLQEQIIIDVNGDERAVKLLKFIPKLNYSKTYVSEATGAPMPRPSNELVAIGDLAAFIEDIEHDHLFRYMVLALNTWARPSTIVNLGPSMMDREHRLLDMNPRGRRQNKKVRPTISITDNLWGWIEYWGREDRAAKLKLDRWVHWRGEGVADISRVFFQLRDQTDEIDGEQVPRHSKVITRYAIRHMMTTVAIRAGVPVQQRERWLGHIQESSDSSNWYGIYEPGFLNEAKAATDDFMVLLETTIRARARAQGRLPRRSVIAPTTHPQAVGANFGV